MTESSDSNISDHTMSRLDSESLSSAGIEIGVSLDEGNRYIISPVLVCLFPRELCGRNVPKLLENSCKIPKHIS